MLSFESVALELLEYKVKDLLAGRQTEGGSAAAWRLYDRLQRSTSTLSAGDAHKLRQLEQNLRSLARSGEAAASKETDLSGIVLAETGSPAPAVNPLLRHSRQAVRLISSDSLPAVTGGEPEEPADPALLAEQLALRELARDVWWHDLGRHIRREAGALRSEKGRYTARLLFAVHRNLLRWAALPESRSDVQLAGFTVREPLPARDDALVSLDDMDSLSELVREILGLIMQLGRPGTPLAGLDLPREESLAYVRTAALRVAADPYAGSTGPGAAARRTGSRELRLALRELERERLPPEQHARQRRELEQRLNATLSAERDERALFERNIRAFSALMRNFFQRIAHLLPESVGGDAPQPRLGGGVIGSRNPLLALPEGTHPGTAVTVKTTGPLDFRLAGLELKLRRQAGMKSLNVAGRESRLEPYFTVASERGTIEGFSAGDWLHLRFMAQGKSLAALLAEALAVEYCQSSAEWPQLRLLLGVLANSSVSEPAALVRQALTRLGELSANAPKRRAAIEGFLKGSARAARVSPPERTLQEVARQFHIALSVGEDQLPALLGSLKGAESALHTLTDEPLEFRLGGQHLTVRRYAGHGRGSTESFAVILPGRTLGSFTDTFIEPLSSGTLVLARADWDLAAVWLAGKTAADGPA